MIVEGAIAVKAAMSSKYRKVIKIYIDVDKHTNDVSYIIQEAYHNRLPVERCSRDMIERMARGRTHGGIVANVSDRRFQSITTMLMKEEPFLALIEGVEDSFNLGYILRSLYAFGCDGVILPQREWDFEDGTMVKSSAGASEFIPIHLTEDLKTTIQTLKDNKIRIVSAYRGENSVNLYHTDLSKGGLMVCVGGPMRGLSREVLDSSDAFVYIPYANDFRNALNAASAASVLASEVYRQRERKG